MREWQAGRAGRYDLDGLITALDGVSRTVIRAVRVCVVQRILMAPGANLETLLLSGF